MREGTPGRTTGRATAVPWRWVRTIVGAVVLGVVVWQTGLAPFADGVRALDVVTLAAAAAVAVVTTAACAWRWHLVARGLGVDVAMGPAVASCYRAQFLNVTLPAGVLGDVHRGVRHGRLAGSTSRGLRSVAWERFAGQVVLVLIVVATLLLVPSPVRLAAPALLAVLVAAAAVAALALRLVPSTATASRFGRLLRGLGDDVRHGLLARAAWPGVVVTSVVAVAGHVATYLLAARAVGVTAPLLTLVPLALLVLLAAGLPLNVAGWGPREGMAAWVFGVAGLGAEQGVATAVAYGVMVVFASLPGVVVLAVGSAPRARGRAVQPSTRAGGPLHRSPT
ncbi:hypothetical protein GCM10023169_37190 [Georgenia halophila]|uniref:Uncharacterized protein n=1 Tax=Georgenia halophila TaxID=620889 RepID=A0ABP8LLE7_9MICO